MEFAIFLKKFFWIFLKKVFLWLFSDENVESCHIGILYDILRLPHEVRVERDHKLQVHNILFIQIRVCVGAYAAGRKVMWAGDGWGFLQISIGLRTPRSLRTANSLSKGFENCLSLLSVAQRIIFRKPHPSPASVTFWTAAWILANSAHGKLVAIHILSGEQIRLRFCRYQMFTEYILKPNSRQAA